MPNPVVHFEIMGKNGKALQNFYATLLDWKIDANSPVQYGLAATQENNIGINGGIGQVEGPVPAYITCYAAVHNLQTYLDKAIKLGATLMVPVTTIPNMVTFCMFKDPEGNIFGMIEAEQTGM